MTTTTQVDVLIIGGGSAGLCAGVWLARAGVSYRILERRPGMLVTGQADGVQVRTVEIFESFGIAGKLLEEAYHVYEVAFWSDGDGKGIARTHTTPDTEPGLSHLPHVILNQARINALLTEEMARETGGEEGSDHIEYGCDVRDVVVDTDLVNDPNAHCVGVTVVQDGVERTYKAKYALGSDGAHSQVRKSLGFKMVGDSSDEVWGVMDVYPKTDFPDIRKKVIIKGASGNLLIIPREGDALVRMYMNLSNSDGDNTTPTTAGDVTLTRLHETARRIFQPYSLEFPETAWWSAYVIGQRLSNEFHAHHRIFLGGDASHTHSPKAGQGMNVSLQDGYNLGWKLAAAVRGQTSSPLRLLETYVSERRKTAADLIDFDRYWSKLFSAPTATTTTTTTTTTDDDGGITAERFVKAGQYTAGLATRYYGSALTDSGDSAAATKLTAGMRFPAARVVRVGDAKPMWLTWAMPADLRWHLVVFGGDVQDSEAAERLQKTAIYLEKQVRAFTPPESDLDSVFNIVLVLSSKRASVELGDIPAVFTPDRGKWKLRDVLKVFVDDENFEKVHGRAYELYGIQPEKGALIVVRPDQYISRIGYLDDVQGVNSFFGKILIRYGL